jgi:hypothetical protein
VSFGLPNAVHRHGRNMFLQTPPNLFSYACKRFRRRTGRIRPPSAIGGIVCRWQPGRQQLHSAGSHIFLVRRSAYFRSSDWARSMRSRRPC